MARINIDSYKIGQLLEDAKTFLLPFKQQKNQIN